MTLRFLSIARRRSASNRHNGASVVGLAALSLVWVQVGCQGTRDSSVRSFVAPQYPYLARVHHEAGTVNVRVEVGPDGKVISAKGSGAVAALVEAAERNATLWQFEAPKQGPHPVAQTITYDFKLRGKPSQVGLTTVQIITANHVVVVDQPAFEKVPEPIPPEGIQDRFDFETLVPELLEDFREGYRTCHGTSPPPGLTLGQLIDDHKRCEQQRRNR